MPIVSIRHAKTVGVNVCLEHTEQSISVRLEYKITNL